MTSSSDAPAASRTVSMLSKVCSVCSARSSLTTLPVLGSKPPWPDRKIHSPTVSPGEYGPGGAGTLSELISAFIDGGLLRSVVVRKIFPESIHTDRYTTRAGLRIHSTLDGVSMVISYTDRYV